MNPIILEPWDAAHRLPRADQGGHRVMTYRPEEYVTDASALDRQLARLVTHGVPRGIAAYQRRRDAYNLCGADIERTYTAYDADIERAHLRHLATSQAPGLPINRRRRRKNVWTALLDRVLDALP